MNEAKKLPVAALAGAAALLSFVMATPDASAEPYLVLEPGAWVLPPTGDWGTSAGLGGNVVGGIGLDLDPLLLSPQLAVGAWGFPGLARSGDVGGAEATDAGAGDEAPARTMSNLRATIGWSVGIAAPIETQVYARLGFGWSADYSPRDPGGGIAIDAGATGDYRFSRDVTLGLQAGYQGFAAFTEPFGSARSVHGITVSPRVGFWF